MLKITRVNGFLSLFCIGLVLMSNLIVVTAAGRGRDTKTDKVSVRLQEQTVTFNGKVKAVTEAALTVVDDQKTEFIIVLDAKTTITKGGKAAAPTDIKADDAVVVVASKGEGDVLTAKAITVA